jgi:peptidoglycan/xylan/chitin deacetylase (PgdA/CDA1 family)
MPSRVLKLLLSLAYFAGVQLRRGLLRLGGRFPAPTCIVLYYHSIAPADRLAFARQMDAVQRLTLPIDGEGPAELLPGKYYSFITFDDAFEDAIEQAVPELVRRRIPALIFVTVDFLGKPASWWPASAPEAARKIATAEQVRALPRQWIKVGAHTLTHPRLSAIGESEARREIAEPRRWLESLVGYEVKSLSFPYGDFDEEVLRWSREAGYRHAFTTQHQNAFAGAESFLVGRVKAEPGDWPVEFWLKLRGGYLWLPQAIALKRRVRQLIGRSRPVGSPLAKKSAAPG